MAEYISVSIHCDQTQDLPPVKRYPAEIKIRDLKDKLELFTGANRETMNVEIYIDNEPAVTLENDEETLVHYVGRVPPRETTVRLVVHDESSRDLLSGDVPKMTISEEKYANRPNNFRKFMKEVREKRTEKDTNQK